MNIKHMPYGMYEQINCGFGRIPVAPLAGETVSIYARLGGEAENVRLQWLADGRAMEDIPAKLTQRPGDSRFYAVFEMQTPQTVCGIDYRIRGGSETSSWFHFDILDECAVDLQDGEVGQGVLQFVWEEGALKVYAPSYLQAGDEELMLDLCVVKRFTEGAVSLLPQIRLRRDARGGIHEVSLDFLIAGYYVWGLGERFEGVNQQDKALSLRLEEHFGVQNQNSYIPVPLVMTEGGAGLYADNLRMIHIAFSRQEGGTRVNLRQKTARQGLLFTLNFLRGTPLDMLKQYHALTGMPALPPKWAMGIWMSANGWNSQRETLHQLDMCRTYDLPATVLVLEAWSDEKTFYLWNDADYEFRGGESCYQEADMSFGGRWPDPRGMISALKEAGIKTVLWQIPVIKRAWEGSNQQLDADEAYAVEQGYCVKNADGTPYRISDGWFNGSLLLDFTNEEAKTWWFSKRQYLLDMGIVGFKTDGGEFLFDEETVLFSGMRGDEAHNAYPLQYVGAYHKFCGLTFSRAGYTGAQTMPIHWAGDQWSTWEALRAQVSAGLSAGLSGIPFWSFDLGGFAGPLPGAELYLRALAVAALCPVMQWHSEPRDGQYEFTADSLALNDRSPWNVAAQTGNSGILDCYRKMAKLRMRLMDYIYQEARFSALSSRPLMAHLVVDHPGDGQVYDIEDQYMFGRDLLVAPVLWENTAQRRVYLPDGRWQDMFSGRWHEGRQWITCECPAGEVPVFARDRHEQLLRLFTEA